MAADSSEKSASEKETPAINIGSGERQRRVPRLSIPRLNKRSAIFALLVVAVLAGGWLLIKKEFHIGEKIYAQVGGHKVYKSDVEALTGNNKGISDHDAAKALADKYLIEDINNGKNIVITDQQLIATYGEMTAEQKKSSNYVHQNRYNQLYFQKLQYYNYGFYEGKFLLTNFSRHIEFDPALPEDKLHDPNLGNPAAIARDKKYAQELITKLYNEVKAGKITFDQAIALEHNDSRVGLKAYPSLSHSGSFNTADNGPLGVFNTASIRNKINGIKSGTMTAPFAVSVNTSVNGTGNKTADSYFLVVRMDKSSGSYTGTDFEQYIKQEKTKFGYKIYV